jgi:hypothetical protein
MYQTPLELVSFSKKVGSIGKGLGEAMRDDEKWIGF